jgi:hypothetical protein
MRAAAAVLDKGLMALRQREQQLAAIEQGDPVVIATAAFSASHQLAKITEAEQRLTRLADKAESAAAVATATQVVSQQLRSVEIGSRLAQVGGYRAPSAVQASSDRGVFHIEMVFQGVGKSETIGLIRPVLDGDLVEPVPPGSTLPAPVSQQKFDGSVAGYWDTAQGVRGKHRDDMSED